MYDMLLITGVYICTLIGAGFASGRELVEFFIGAGSYLPSILESLISSSKFEVLI